MKFVTREAFCICGYAVETTAAENGEDLTKLFKDFFDNDKETILQGLRGSKKGYYGLMWYTHGHEKYFYLLGIEMDKENEPPENALLKVVPKTTYAVAFYQHDKDPIEAWGEFYYTDIPNEGYAVDEELNIFFEYHPKSVDGDYELWVPVVNTHV